MPEDSNIHDYAMRVLQWAPDKREVVLASVRVDAYMKAMAAGCTHSHATELAISIEAETKALVQKIEASGGAVSGSA